MITKEHTNYRSYLRDLLIERKKKNPQFSLRGFAKTLGIQPAFLSYILNGKRDLSDDMIVQFVERLHLKEREAKIFELLVKLERAKNTSLKKHILDALNELTPNQSLKRDLSVDQFMMISEWHHFALFMLIDLPGFEWSTSNAAKALGINTFQVDQALERLSALELIECETGKAPMKLEPRIIIESKSQAEAINQYHTQILDKAKTAVTQIDTLQRFTGTETIHFSADQMKEASAIFEDCFQKMIALSKKAKKEKEIYSLGIVLFPLTQASKKTTPSKGPKK